MTQTDLERVRVWAAYRMTLGVLCMVGMVITIVDLSTPPPAPGLFALDFRGLLTEVYWSWMIPFALVSANLLVLVKPKKILIWNLLAAVLAVVIATVLAQWMDQMRYR
jgi:hypothetical protein